MPSQTLSLSQSQRLQQMLAPQLRQSLEMLQLPLLELRALIQQEIEQNPTVEETPARNETIEIETGTNEAEQEEKKELTFDEEFEVLSRLDEEWKDYFFQDFKTSGYSPEAEEKHQYLLDSLPQQESLQEHLLNQLNLAGLTETDRQVGELIIGSVDQDGYLTTSLEDLAASTGADIEHIDNVLHLIQEFHPTGIAARDLRECLLIQLDRLDKTETLAARIVSESLDLLGARKYQNIMKAHKISMQQVEEAVKLIGTLDPKPGRVYSDEATTYVFPEIHVQKVDGAYVVILDDEQLPHVRISNHYKRLLQDPNTKPEVKTYVQERIRSGAFMIKSIHQRQRTIHRIATEIVSAQTAFLDHGVSHLKPLTMSTIAEKVGVHETTVSRAVSGKYMKTPSGLYELKYFFTPGIKTDDGGQVSNKTVKDMIAGLVSNENPASPLSDQDIMEALKKRNINIARRTIAKYRLMLKIPPSHMRKGF